MIETLLTFSILICIILIINIKDQAKYQSVVCGMILLLTCLIIWCVGMLFQIIAMKYAPSINPIYFDYITYIGICFSPVLAIVVAMQYNNLKVNKKIIFLLSIVPISSLLVLWTNDFHGLFYKKYSVNFSESIYGPMFYVNQVYTYLLLIIFLISMISSTIKNSGLFSMQSGLIVLGSIVPLIANILGTLKIISISIYITPILFIFMLICYAISIVKYKSLSITPIANRIIMDTISDSFIVISKDGTIVNKNSTYDRTLKNVFDFKINDNIYKKADSGNIENKSILFDLINKINEAKTSENIICNEYYISKIDKYFEIDIKSIFVHNKKLYAGTLLLFKDITQHKKDIETIKEKQDIIVKQGQLSSIGELAGGVAHDINTPISAIKSGILMFKDMLGERTPQELELLQRMDNCADKIIKIVNSMRNQIRNLGSDQSISFKISDIITDIKVLVYNELTKHNCTLSVNVIDNVSIKGDPTKFGQVITNLVVNAIQAYDKNGGSVEIRVSKDPNNVAIVSVTDHAGGIDEKIKPYIFKNILTTKGTKGTGLGLYLAYSIIKSSFNGDMKYDSEVGEGTTFYITIPIEPEKTVNQINV